MYLLRHLVLALLLASSVAHAGVSDRAYERAIELVERLYLYPEDVEASALLHGAAQGLADHIDWLLVETQGDAVYLRHGDGTAIGSVSVASMATLPDALRALEGLVREAGYDLQDVDPRLEVLKGMTRSLDRYSRVLAGDRLERFDVRLKGTLVGIGATLRMVNGTLEVQELVGEGPASRGGVRVGDKIVRIDGVSTTNMPLSDATHRIRGTDGTELVLTILRDGIQHEVHLVRSEVVIANVKHRVLPGNVGYVQITHFSQRTVDNLVAALDALREAGALGKGIVIDLRGNTGGSMKEAARSADQFVEEGMLLRTAGPDGGQVQNLQARMDALDTEDEPPIAITVLMDRRTASGSEILAGALLELDRAVLIGTRSYGKGTVQKIYNLDEETRLKLTVAQYLLADDRSISAGGLVPDVALADIELQSDAVRFQGWSRYHAGKEFEDILPVVVERSGWRGRPETLRDVPLELARRAVLRSAGPSRTEVLASLEEASREVLAEEEARLVEALAGRGIDWSPAPPPAEGAPPVEEPAATVRVQASRDPERTDVVVLQAEVVNGSEVPLHRALVQLTCDTLSVWSGLAIPIGRIEPGQAATGRISITLPPGLQPRQDAVSLELRTDGRPALYVGDQLLEAHSSDLPRIAVRTRLTGEGPRRRAQVLVKNLSRAPLTGVQVYFVAPGDLGVELVDRAAFRPVVAGGQEERFDLELILGEGVGSDHLPMELVVESERYERLAEWPVDLPLDGREVELEAPRIRARDIPLSAPVGAWTVGLDTEDDRAIHHMVLYLNGHKVAWAGGEGGRAQLRTSVVLDPGVNRLVAVSEDDQGLRQQHAFVVRGESEAAVDAHVEEVVGPFVDEVVEVEAQ